jgi:hypothetical protein
MKKGSSWQTLESCSKAALLVSLPVSGCGTALVVHFVAPPSKPGSLPTDYHFENFVVSTILNLGLPLTVLATTVLALAAVRVRPFRPFPAIAAAVALVSVFAPVLSVWSCLVALHGGVYLWSRIWWSFA